MTTSATTLLGQVGEFEALDRQLASLLAERATAEQELVGVSTLLLSRATRQGHVCLELTRWANLSYLDVRVLGPEGNGAPRERLEALDTAVLPSAENWKRRLEGSKIVGEAGSGLPLIVEGSRLYLSRYHGHERALASRLEARLGRTPLTVESERIAAVLTRWFVGAPVEAKQAAAIAVARRLCILAGGPGTGKTSTVVRLVGALAELERLQGKRAPRIWLLAPTGKAAARLSESMRTARERLAERLPEVLTLPVEAMTLHRALLSRERSSLGGELPLMADLIVIDEASMVDLSLMRRLFDAASRTERVVVLGDPNQLASVEAGVVLGDICGSRDGTVSNEVAGELAAYAGTSERSSVARAPRVGDVVVELVQSHRFRDDSGIGRIAKCVRDGDLGGLEQVLASDEPAVDFIELEGYELEPVFERIWGCYEPLRKAETPEAALAALARFRLLCVHRSGRYGIERWNERMEVTLARVEAHRGRRFARPVLIRKNDPSVALFNGDLGISCEEPNTGVIRTHFPSDAGAVRSFSRGRLPENEPAFAMSVHKSQGSEVDEVLILLPDASSPLLTREVLYTAVTRARQRCTIAASREALRVAVARRVERQSGLLELLRGQP